MALRAHDELSRDYFGFLPDFYRAIPPVCGLALGNLPSRLRLAAVTVASEQAIVQRIVALRRSGLSYRAIAATLDREGFRAYTAESWSAMIVRNIALREGVLR